MWLEATRFEPEVGGVVRWDLTATNGLSRLSARLLERGPFDLGPAITPREEPEEPGSTPPARSGVDDDEAGSFLERAEDTTGVPVEGAASLLGAIVLLVGVSLALRARRRRMRPPWL